MTFSSSTHVSLEMSIARVQLVKSHVVVELITNTSILCLWVILQLGGKLRFPDTGTKTLSYVSVYIFIMNAHSLPFSFVFLAANMGHKSQLRYNNVCSKEQINVGLGNRKDGQIYTNFNVEIFIYHKYRDPLAAKNSI